MATTTTTTAIVPLDPVFADPKRLALGAFLAGCSGRTRDAYELDLRQFVGWCDDHELDLFEVRRADIEAFARDLEGRGRARATMARRLCTVTSFYRYAEEERLLAHSPAVHVRRPRIDYESHATGLDRNEVGAPLVSAGLGNPTEHALVSLLVLNGLRASEATGAAIDVERGHRTLTILRKGRQDCHYPTRTSQGPGDRPGARRAVGRADLYRRRWSTSRPPRCGADCSLRREAGGDRQAGRPAHAQACVHHRRPRRRRSARDVQEAASHADSPTTMRCDRTRFSLDRHVTYIVAAFLAGAAR